MANGNSRRERGTGNIYQRGDKWVGRLDVTEELGRKPDGKRNIKYFSGKSEAEVKRKIREYNKEGGHIPANKISVSDYATNWLESYKKPALKRSSYDRLENTVNHQIKPSIGMIQLQQLTSDDIQKMLADLQKAGKSYSSIKKAHDCIGAITHHALIAGDIEKDPMILVTMPNKGQFDTKEIRIFSQNEARAIVEEVGRTYSNGNPVYPYGEAYILMLNTGIREGELIALLRDDWDEKAGTIRVTRTSQSVKKRGEDGKAKGYELITNTTKTYSGERTIHLNAAATAAVKSMVKRYPNSKYLMCNSKGDIIPPANFTRSFYRILENVGIKKTGPHALRHTFASFCFANGVDVKTVSKILGHASIQITLNTYIHLLEGTEKDAVLSLDTFL